MKTRKQKAISTQKGAKMIHQFTHQKDLLLASISIEELVMTVESNEDSRSWETVENVFDEILDMAIKDARDQLQDKKNFILNIL